MSTNKDYKWVGTRPIRPDGADKVTGKAAFGADKNLPGMLHGKILRSPYGHAKIKSIDRFQCCGICPRCISSNDL